MIKMLQIIACKTITVLIKAIVSASLLSPTFSPRAFAHILQNFFIALAAGVEPATYGLEVRCAIQTAPRGHGGKGGIRTHGGCDTSTVFKTGPFVHSGTFPLLGVIIPVVCRNVNRVNIFTKYFISGVCHNINV